jgi:hypothetical protein
MKRKLRMGRVGKEMRGLADMDYVDDLSNEDAEWLNKFCREYYSDVGLEDEETLHDNAEAAKKDQRQRAYAARADAYSQTIFHAEQKDEVINHAFCVSDLHWEEFYELYGYQRALEFILSQTLEDIGTNVVEAKEALDRFHDKRLRLKRKLARKGKKKHAVRR